MVVYKKISPWGTDKDFSKHESRDLPQSKNQKLGSNYFFVGCTLFTVLSTGLFYSPLSDLQDPDADSDVCNTDCDINNASKRKAKLHGWQYFMHE